MINENTCSRCGHEAIGWIVTPDQMSQYEEARMIEVCHCCPEGGLMRAACCAQSACSAS